MLSALFVLSCGSSLSNSCQLASIHESPGPVSTLIKGEIHSKAIDIHPKPSRSLRLSSTGSVVLVLILKARQLTLGAIRPYTGVPARLVCRVRSATGEACFMCSFLVAWAALGPRLNAGLVPAMPHIFSLSTMPAVVAPVALLVALPFISHDAACAGARMPASREAPLRKSALLGDSDTHGQCTDNYSTSSHMHRLLKPRAETRAHVLQNIDRT